MMTSNSSSEISIMKMTSIAKEDNIKRMMSFVEPLGHSQIVDRQSLASLPVGYIKLTITDDSRALKVKMTDFMKTLTKKPSGNLRSQTLVAQVSVKGYLASSNIVFESKATADQSTNSGGKACTLMFDKKEIVSSLGKCQQLNDLQTLETHQMLQVCVFTYPTPYRMKTFLGTVHVSISDMRLCCEGNFTLSSYYKIFPTSSFVAGCPVIGVDQHCVNHCKSKTESPLDKICTEAKPKLVSKPLPLSRKLQLTELAQATSTNFNERKYSSRTAREGISKSNSLRAIVSAFTHRRRILQSKKPVATVTTTTHVKAIKRNKIDSDASLDNGYGSSSGDSCSRSSNAKLNDSVNQKMSLSPPKTTHTPRITCQNHETILNVEEVTTPKKNRLITQASIDSIRSLAASSSNTTDSIEDIIPNDQCAFPSEYCQPAVYDGLNYFSVSTSAIGSNSLNQKNYKKTLANTTGRGKSIQGIVSSMKTFVYSVKSKSRISSRSKDVKSDSKFSLKSSKSKTSAPSSVRSFSLGPLTNKDEYTDEKDNVFEVLASLKQIRSKKMKDNSDSLVVEEEEPQTSNAPNPEIFDENKSSSDDGVSFSTIDVNESAARLLPTSAWSCEDCILASLAEKSMTSHSNRAARCSTRKLIRQKCFRSTDDISLKASSGDSSYRTSPRLNKVRRNKLMKVKPVVDDDIGAFGQKILKVKSQKSETPFDSSTEDEEDFHSCTGGDWYTDLMSLASSYQSLNCFVAEDVFVR